MNDLSPSYFKTTTIYYYKHYYNRNWARVPPFLVGVLTALFLYSFKNDNPEESRIKRIMDKINSSRIIRYAMYTIGSFVFWASIFIFHWINNYPESFSKFFNIAFLTTSRGIFVIGLTLVILPVLMGHFSLLRKMLSIEILNPIARLCFGAYMVHPTLMLFEALNAQRGEFMSINFGIMRYFSWLIASFAVSFLFILFVETPFMNLERYFVTCGNKTPPKKVEEPRRPQVVEESKNLSAEREMLLERKYSSDNEDSMENNKNRNLNGYSINGYRSDHSEGANMNITTDSSRE